MGASECPRIRSTGCDIEDDPSDKKWMEKHPTYSSDQDTHNPQQAHSESLNPPPE
ncbi:hypothetical protein AZE42_07425 [Rhizopogon vesiculosus]|uniref:Uncharacterized protein n=1 Tax=Rhizopogon vesiculosus TaxID=180088 RepID=A0A1J8PKM8_9AGAM|nr:hypothetical protein AZE42_07425 [Rhizopogon vesiculosus]